MGNQKLSIFLSLVLRHKPEEAGVSLDENGWVDVKKLIDGINKTGRSINFQLLKEIVDSDNKQRYSFNQDFSKIRANQGHSIPIKLKFNTANPPDVLYHGTSTKNLDSIKLRGIKPMSRQYVHLSDDIKTAENVGSRHCLGGLGLVVLVIDAKRMSEDGVDFYLSDNGVWMSDLIEWKYIKNIIYAK